MYLNKNSAELQGLSEEELRNLLGGKGAGLVYMANNGLNVPPFVILPTTLYAAYDKAPVATMKSIAKCLPSILNELKAAFGYQPLMSVRSGARVSCPGMMDTILNVGLVSTVLKDWESRLGAACVADSAARLDHMYQSVVGVRCPKTVKEQLLGSIEAVFKSWNNDRARFYRKMNSIPDEWGTAVVIQAMVFGNMNENSGTGVLFTRNPDTGADEVTGEFLINAQGEDVVDGSHTPLPLADMTAWNPQVAEKLMTTVCALETARQDVQDVEFTIQDGELFILQTRNAKRSAKAAVRIALDMVVEQLISIPEAITRVGPRTFDLAQICGLDPAFKVAPAYTGTPACSGVVTGKPVYSAAAAIECKEPCILVTSETAPDDIAGMHAAVGVLTMTGGATSHAAVVARSMNKPCVVGLGTYVPHLLFKGGSSISIDGATGRVWDGSVPVIAPQDDATITAWKKMVIDFYNVVPIGAQDFHTEEVLLDLTQLVLAKNAPALYAAVRIALSKAWYVYVDIRTDSGTEAARVYNRMFSCGDEEQYALTVLYNELLPEEIKRVTLLTTLKDTKGFKTIGTPSDLSSLILATDYVAVDTLTPDASTAKVLRWLKNDGVKVVSLGSYNPACKSFMSVPMAMQLAAGA